MVNIDYIKVVFGVWQLLFSRKASLMVLKCSSSTLLSPRLHSTFFMKNWCRQAEWTQESHQASLEFINFFIGPRADKNSTWYFLLVLGLKFHFTSYIPGPPTILVWCTNETRMGGLRPRDLHQQRARRAHDRTFLRLWPMDWQPYCNWRRPRGGEFLAMLVLVAVRFIPVSHTVTQSEFRTSVGSSLFLVLRLMAVACPKLVL